MSYAQTILALVKRWHTLEPDRCGPWKGEPHDVYPTAYFLERRHPRSTGRICFTEAGAMQIGGDEELLFAVIEATTARGWVCRLESDVPSAGKWYATVWTGSGPRPTRLSYDGMANEPTKAYLRAYLAALEVEAAQ